MEDIRIQKINECIVKPPSKLEVDHGNEICRGKELFETRFANIFLLARRKMGKTTTLNYIVRKSVTKNTTVIIFSSTISKDVVMKNIVTTLKNKGVPVVSYISIYDDDKMNRLEEFVDYLQQKQKCKCYDDIDIDYEDLNFDDDDIDCKCKKGKKEYLLILDDLSDELQNKKLTSLMKNARHFRTRIIISNQYLNDVAKSSRLQLDYLLIWGGLPDDKLKEIHKNLDIGVSLETFIDYYNIATKSKFSFLYCDIRTNEFRINFDNKIIN